MTELLSRLRQEDFPRSGAVVLGGGCAGLALAVALVEAGGAVAVVEARTGDRDERTWCYWDTGQAVMPEAASRSWDRWEVRAGAGRVVASDAAHPYRMVRARDYRAVARERLARSATGRIVDGVRVSVGADERPGGRDVPRLFDARGPMPSVAVPAGRVLLHQRFVGQWIRTTRPVFDTAAVTLMDFPESRAPSGVRFFYVLPVAADLALVECTVFSAVEHVSEPFRRHIADYVRSRWGLDPGEWQVEGQEAGSIPMTDAPAPWPGRSGVPLGLRAGAARPSTGYAYTRIQLAARRIASAGGRGAPPIRDPFRTRVLDAVFLRFLRDQPHRAPEVFLRLFGRLPGPLTVRFLTERSTLRDDLRLVLALPKAPFLRAAATTARERLRAVLP
ncbi:lycopene cyclase family protein [Amnibacterium kyonggiense]|uniref:Lycopene beta-cyclase n=1 Tax=Amnibacterium kyonggiense TaxID=595671 RepID=A0A4R7FGI4_9MICO|nr:lycopene cyclase family protein [Amnibacterium kyonggiense]TDS75795.1 lycopene beta-cyclase [Amnibacterium kyonggiense]